MIRHSSITHTKRASVGKVCYVMIAWTNSCKGGTPTPARNDCQICFFLGQQTELFARTHTKNTLRHTCRNNSIDVCVSSMSISARNPSSCPTKERSLASTPVFPSGDLPRSASTRHKLPCPLEETPPIPSFPMLITSYWEKTKTTETRKRRVPRRGRYGEGASGALVGGGLWILYCRRGRA